MLFFRLRPVVAVLAVLGIAATVQLGNWQRHKAAFRTAQQERIVLAQKDPPVELAGYSGDPAALAWRRVAARGVWQPENVIYLDNRPNQGRVGLYVLMPLKLADGRILVVNRGWVPRDPVERSHIAPFKTPGGEVLVVGVARADEDRFLELAPAPTPKTQTIWENFDYAAFAQATGSPALRCIVREDGDAQDGLDRTWPDRGLLFEKDIDRNRGYAFQWYAMSAAILLLCLFYGFRNARHIRHA